MPKYYEAYDKRYRQVHAKSISWESDENSPIVIETIQKYVKVVNPKILDIGCGEGRDCLFLLNLGYDVQALDVSNEAINYCKRKVSATNRRRFHVVDVCTDSFDGAFDFIYSVATLHMLVLKQDRQQYFDFIKGHLSKGGYALILSMGDGHTEIESNVHEAFQDKIRIHQQTGEEMLLAATSCKTVGFDTFRKELHDSGFDIVDDGITVIENHFSSIMYAVVR